MFISKETEQRDTGQEELRVKYPRMATDAVEITMGLVYLFPLSRRNRFSDLGKLSFQRCDPRLRVYCWFMITWAAPAGPGMRT